MGGHPWDEGWATARGVATVARHEFMTFLRRRTFLFTTLFLPLFGACAGFAAGGAGAVVGRGLTSAFDISDTAAAAQRRVGYVDPEGFVKRLPPGIDGVEYVAYPDEAAARRGVGAGEIEAAFVLPRDYPATSEVERISTGLQARGGDRLPLDYLLWANLWPEADASDIAAMAAPGKLVDLALDLPRYRMAQGNVVALAVPLLLGVMLYSAIFTVSSFLLQSVTSEKESRVLEVLLTSVRPLALLSGKVIGLGALGLVQVAVWGGLGLLVGRSGGAALLALAGLRVGPGVLGVATLFFLLGYFFFASLMGAVGALAPSFKESGALTFVVLFPAWIPFFVLEAILSEPNGSLARGLTLLPPTAPLVVLVRVVSAPVPPGEILASAALLLVSSALVLWVAARLFSASILLAGGVPAPRDVWAALVGPSASG